MKGIQLANTTSTETSDGKNNVSAGVCALRHSYLDYKVKTVRVRVAHCSINNSNIFGIEKKYQV